MYIFEINLKNSPSALCDNKEGRGAARACVSTREGQQRGKRYRWTSEREVIG